MSVLENNRYSYYLSLFSHPKQVKAPLNRLFFTFFTVKTFSAKIHSENYAEIFNAEKSNIEAIFPAAFFSTLVITPE